jgi:hypothetical protein
MDTADKNMDTLKTISHHAHQSRRSSKHKHQQSQGNSQQRRKMVSQSQSHWYCDNCNFGGMTPFHDHCPGCQHRRCQNCTVEVTWFRFPVGREGARIEDTFNSTSRSSSAIEDSSSETSATRYQEQSAGGGCPTPVNSTQLV